ncbi:MAG: helicase C-terminal domain-containing protein [Benniella sp.]|nr:MAG: helicase C-terminal domain-containing protein [Benniella sp.]
MTKRTRTLPPTIARDKGKGKASTASSSSATVQTQLKIVNESSDSEDNNKRPWCRSSEDEGSGSRKRSRSGYAFKRTASNKSLQAAADAAAALEASSTEFITGGITIKFPFTPYKSQQDMMSKIVEALQKKENALLESPTGSGKSLALLCGALAWLESEKKKQESERKKQEFIRAARWKTAEVTESPYFADPPSQNSAVAGPSTSVPPASLGCGSCISTCGTTGSAGHSALASGLSSGQSASAHGSNQPFIKDERDLGSKDKNIQSSGQNGQSNKRIPVELKYEDPSLPAQSTQSTTETSSSEWRLPKIYFGTRTHKQITQLVKELYSNTVYRPKMSVLGSRNHYCINSKLKDVQNKNEACQELLDSEIETCVPAHRTDELVGKMKSLKDGKNRIWDMEDLIGRGKNMRACPYFAARSLAEYAELIFCPYNYLIDPHISKAMELDLTNAILILDEAHNIEDVSRDAGGLELDQNDLKQAADKFENMSKSKRTLLDERIIDVEHFASTRSNAQCSKKLKDFAETLLKVLSQTTLHKKEYEVSSEIWTGRDLIGILDQYGLNSRTIFDYDMACNQVSAALKKSKERRRARKEEAEKKGTQKVDPDGKSEGATVEEVILMSVTKAVRDMEGILTIIKRLVDPISQCVDDYKVLIIEVIDRPDDDEGSGVGAAKRQTSKLTQEHDLTKRIFKFWCLNPGVIFRPISTQVRSVILTSGTLSPMDSFASELQTTFSIQLEADHVINKKQVWAGVIRYGPQLAGVQPVEFNGVFQTCSQYTYQDHLGHAIERIIRIIPHGVLCFVSSYHQLENLMKRWRSTGQYERFSVIKKVMQEPRRATAKAFDKILKQYYNHISGEVAKGSDGGAILFAVYRGKCSEGIDFTDANCRAVLAVGIPFPAMYDSKIRLKMAYNDQQQARMTSFTPTQVPAGSAARELFSFTQSVNFAESSSTSTQQIPAIPQTGLLLKGSRWYEIQAFRAYNQAIGRCIRHRKDWGAMILLESRLAQLDKQRNLSKWVRPLVQTFGDFQSGFDSINEWILPIKSMPDPTLEFPEEPLGSESVLQGTHPQISSSLQEDIDMSDISFDQSVQKGDAQQGVVLYLDEELSQVSQGLVVGGTSGTPRSAESSRRQGGAKDVTIHTMAMTAARESEAHDRFALENMATEIARVHETQDQGQKDEFEDLDMDSGWDDLSENDVIREEFNADHDLSRGEVGMKSRYIEDEYWTASLEADITEGLNESFDENTTSEPFDTRNILGRMGLTPTQSQDNKVVSAASMNVSSSVLASGSRSGANNVTAPPVSLDVHASTSNGQVDSVPTIPAPASSQGSASAHAGTKPAVFPRPARSWFRRPSITFNGTASSSIRKVAPKTVSNESTLHRADQYSTIQVVCKVCSEPLLSCLERPKIKKVLKSMAKELIQNRKRLAQSSTVQAPLSQPTLWSMGVSTALGATSKLVPSVLSSFGKLKRTKTTQVFSGIGKGRSVSSPSLLLTANSTGSGSGSEEPPPMILLVHKSEVLEKFFAKGGSDEVDCVWRPQDGLVYQRIMCPKCSRAKQIPQVFMGSSSSGRSPSGSRSDTSKQPHPIVGLKGVLIVGRSDMEPTEDEDTEGIGTIWLTAGEIRLL